MDGEVCLDKTFNRSSAIFEQGKRTIDILINTNVLVFLFSLTDAISSLGLYPQR